MKRKEIFNVIGMIDDDLTEEAGRIKRSKKRRALRTAAVAAAAAVILCISAFAANIILTGRSGHSSSIPSYYSAPNPGTLLDDVGFSAVIPDSFSNGYTFKSGHIAENEDYDEDGNLFESYKGLSCVYVKDGNGFIT